MSVPPSTDFGAVTAPDQQVAIISADTTLAFVDVDGRLNRKPLGTLHWGFGVYDHSIRVTPGTHTIQVSYRIPQSIMLRHVRIQVAAGGRYRFTVDNDQVRFGELSVTGMLLDIPLHEQILSADMPNRPTTVIINVVRHGSAMPATQPGGSPFSSATLRPAPTITNTSAPSPDGPPLSRATLQPEPANQPEPAISYDEWLKQHPEMVRKADADSAN